MKYINEEKIKVIKLEKDNMYVAIDFDKTITSEKSDDSWSATGMLLGDEFDNKLTELYKKYRPMELDYTITFKEKNEAMEIWYQACMDLYYEYHLTREKLNKSIEKSNLIFREGAQEFLKEMYNNNIPVVILSAGIGNVIEKFLKDNKCCYDNIVILSNFIKFDKNGNMLKFEDNMIHTLNKNTEGKFEKDYQMMLNNKQYKMLLGDTIEDKKMVPEKDWKNTITIGFLSEKIEENLEVYRKNFDIVLTNEDANYDIVKNIIKLNMK